MDQDTILLVRDSQYDMRTAFARGYDPKREGKFVVAVVPAYNEDRFIASVVLKTRMYTDLVLVVDDGSSDQTEIVAREAGAETIVHFKNMGKGCALRTGFARASALGADIVVTLDGDGQHDPANIPAMIDPILQDKADMIIGSRFTGMKNHIPAWRRVGQHALTAITNLASGVPTSDSQSGFRAFSCRALETLDIHSKGFAVESEMQFWAREQGLRMQEVPIACIYAEKIKRNPFRQALQVIDGILGLVSQSRPLLCFGASGSLLFLGGMAGWGWILHTYDRTGKLALGYGLLAMLLIIIGTVTGFEGITLHRMRAMMQHLRSGENRDGDIGQKQPQQISGQPGLPQG